MGTCRGSYSLLPLSVKIENYSTYHWAVLSYAEVDLENEG